MKQTLLSLLSLIPITALAQILPTNAVVDEKTLAEWSAELWKWNFLIPTNRHPQIYPSGEWANENQPTGSVFFVTAGIYGRDNLWNARFTVPEGKYLFFSPINIEGDNIDVYPPWSPEEIRAAAAALIDATTNLYVSLDGVSITNPYAYRFASPVFSLDLPSCNNFLTYFYGHCISGLIDPMISDGFWFMLPPLPVGEHVLAFGGAVGPPSNYRVNITNYLTVVPNHVAQSNSVIDGRTIEEWSAEWWKWLFSTPVSRNPLFDTNGASVHEGQPGGEVFFLAGASAAPSHTEVHRRFSVPADKRLFFPLLNFYADNVFVDPPFTVPELRNICASFAEAVVSLHASIDGLPVPTSLFQHRAISPVFSFAFTNEDNLESYWAAQPFTGLDDPIVSDGYWLMLEPLPVGAHTIRFGGSNGPPWNSSVDVTAHITVEPDPLSYVLPSNSVVAGKTIGEWAAAADNWLDRQSTNQHPFLDPDGRWAGQQQEGPVFFVAGYPPDKFGPALTRSYAVPAGKYLLIPVLGIRVDNIDTEPPWSEPMLRDYASLLVSNPRDLFFSLDGVPVVNCLEHRPYVPAFGFNYLSPDNIRSFYYTHPITGLVDPIILDGYWIMLAPLPVGTHQVRFGGAYNDPGALSFSRTDHITVTERFTSVPTLTNGVISLRFEGGLGLRYVLEASTNLTDWTAISTNLVTSVPFELFDPGAGGTRHRFYRTVVQGEKTFW